MTVDFPTGFAWPTPLSPRAVAYVAGWAVGLGRCHVAKAEVMRDRDADGPVLAIVVDVLAPRLAKEFQPFSVLHRPHEFGWERGRPARYVVGIELAELNERAERVEDVVEAGDVFVLPDLHSPDPSAPSMVCTGIDHETGTITFRMELPK